MQGCVLYPKFELLKVTVPENRGGAPNAEGHDSAHVSGASSADDPGQSSGGGPSGSAGDITPPLAEPSGGPPGGGGGDRPADKPPTVYDIPDADGKRGRARHRSSTRPPYYTTETWAEEEDKCKSTLFRPWVVFKCFGTFSANAESV